MAIQARRKKGIDLQGHKIRKGDLIIAGENNGLVVKVTPKYIYYIMEGHEGRLKKENLWNAVDTNPKVFVSYGSKQRRRKQRRMRTLDLHGTKHQDAEEEIKKFLNFIELPCKIITGGSDKMRDIATTIVGEYGWSCHQESAQNTGALIVVEKGYD